MNTTATADSLPVLLLEIDLAQRIPDLDFVHLAAGMGVEGVRIEKADDIAPTLAKAVAANRPYLVEIAIEGKR